MGMFDEVSFAAGVLPPDLPAWSTDPSHQWQTKDFEYPYLERYAVTSDGRLVKDGHDIDFHGDLGVHTLNSRASGPGGYYTQNGEPCEWLRLSVRFTHGRLESVRIIEHEILPARPYAEYLTSLSASSTSLSAQREAPGAPAHE